MDWDKIYLLPLPGKKTESRSESQFYGLIPVERNFPQMPIFFVEFTGTQQKTSAPVVVGVNQNLEKLAVSRVIFFSNKYFIQLLWKI